MTIVCPMKKHGPGRYRRGAVHDADGSRVTTNKHAGDDVLGRTQSDTIGDERRGVFAKPSAYPLAPAEPFRRGNESLRAGADEQAETPTGSRQPPGPGQPARYGSDPP